MSEEEYEVVTDKDVVKRNGETVFCPLIPGRCQPNCVMNYGGACAEAEALKAVDTGPPLPPDMPPALKKIIEDVKAKGGVTIVSKDLPPELLRMMEFFMTEAKNTRKRNGGDQVDDDYQE
jgi:hypothetical protein